ncbi:MAG: hypothetical protein UR18_C0006G0037 [Candidatus Nomurabacteria bacterium GW2011_GWE2_31_40]|nr:MAG: hypothetical protein UR18_C0006G0037 [Candidatus Nomurabacteria bacterium GW2011_GWE2_31_40]OGV06187.1 MAG: hypothetical protein A2299_12175 [Stygiobacter sp. RIFOXYB2_FULL_37_11]OGV15937.1 MAG: hypothetical protein A2440_03105 [Stygiobacter sp. RIFOXYC2_FULL_38_25]OGV27881.1 MAG: hypothetical protein A2499_17210 [Stygiobacter sp. RIFOXYC12_FULL_38_8]OGV80414.1 MAG: hypothetical protein A2X65_04265 [Stygiobacter sp. GWF2_38_21]
MNEVDEVKAVGIMKKMRTDLHRAIVTHMNVIGLTESEEIIERFKRWYLFDYFNVETSRALSIEGLEAAKKQLKTVTLEEALKGITRKYHFYTSDKQLVRCTQGQVNKIYAVALGSLKMGKEKMFEYINTSLHREVWKFKMSMTEADTVIKRLENFEVKKIRDKRNERENNKR